jgi:hypothetical protein
MTVSIQDDATAIPNRDAVAVASAVCVVEPMALAA